MRREEILTRWSSEGCNDAEALIRWNKDAPRFGAMALPAQDSSMAMRIMYREKMIVPGTTGLDVGCGGGRFSLALQKCGMQMHGTDFAPAMIEAAERSRDELGVGTTFSVDNWHTLRLEDKGWEHRFDLVMAHMTPAVIDAKTYLKLIAACRGWVLMLKPTRWHSPLMDELRGILPPTHGENALDDAFCDAFSLAWLEGFSPRTEYDHSVWQSDQTVDEAVRSYVSRLPRSLGADPAAGEKVRAFLQERFPDGNVRDEVHTQIAAIWFHV